MKRLSWVLVSALVACAPQSGNLPAAEQAGNVTQSTSETKPIPNEPAVTVASTCASPQGSSRRAQACWRWRCDADPDAAAPWDGSASTCTAGDLDPAAADRALRRINVHRFLADVAPFVAEPSWTAAAQQCALIAHANGELSHTPPSSWSCWSESGAAASAGSLVANRSVAASIAAYFEDPGNERTMVHRRWLLDETLASVGFGSTNEYSCVVVDGTSIGRASAKPTGARGWSAWPPAGPVPFDVFTDEDLDLAGWTVQSTGPDLDDANIEVTVTSARSGSVLPITLTHLTALDGSRSAIRFVPVGWTTAAGQSYAVHITGAAAIDFTVEPVDCDAL